ncbi:MFS transporter [Microbulbifer epialgicus]|uniref:MFS transporter n=1 Tax=Microbulbifer epialgicus TaxID=393907 RepID=A0ABV4P8K7_9GAMM
MGNWAALTKDQLWGLAALSFALFFVSNDITILSGTIPIIETDFGGDFTNVQWLLNGYTLVVGVLIISGGRLADIFGRRRIFFIGSVIFVFFSVICGLAKDFSILLASRALMGIGGAMIWPSILGMIYNLIPRERSGIAGGLVMAVTGISLTIGPILGGVITDIFNWRLTFFLNPIEAAIACFMCWKFVTDDTPKNLDAKIDYAGVTTLSVSLFSLLFALDLSVDFGFKNPLIIILMALFLFFFGVFVIVEYRVKDNALIPRDIAGNYRLFAAGFATLVISVVFFSPIFYIPQFFSKIHGYSATLAGIVLLPMLIVFSVISYVSGNLYKSFNPRVIASAGSALIFIGMFMLSNINKNIGIIGLAPGLIFLGAGMGFFYPTITTFSITVVAPSRSSLAAGIIYMFRVAGGSLGLAINTTIVAFSPSLPNGIARAFTVNSYLALTALVICLLFVDEKRNTGKFVNSEGGKKS